MKSYIVITHRMFSICQNVDTCKHVLFLKAYNFFLFKSFIKNYMNWKYFLSGSCIILSGSCLPNDLQSTRTKKLPKAYMKDPACNDILNLNWIQESEP